MTASRPDLYAILGVDPSATQEQITQAYRSLLRRHHPDTRPPGDHAHHAEADATLEQVLAAYATLGDPARRAAYDRQRGTRAQRARPARPASVASRFRGQPPIVAGPVYWRPGPGAPR
jgi:molecular chaperone DnaJ